MPRVGDTMTDKEMRAAAGKFPTRAELVLYLERMWQRQGADWVCLGDGSDNAS